MPLTETLSIFVGLSTPQNDQVFYKIENLSRGSRPKITFCPLIKKKKSEPKNSLCSETLRVRSRSPTIYRGQEHSKVWVHVWSRNLFSNQQIILLRPWELGQGHPLYIEGRNTQMYGSMCLFLYQGCPHATQIVKTIDPGNTLDGPVWQTSCRLIKTHVIFTKLLTDVTHLA
jgi:hypothetical protein